MTLIEEVKYWHNLVKEMAVNMDNNAISYFRLKDITQELILKYSNHQNGCQNGICHCGYNKILEDFKKLK